MRGAALLAACLGWALLGGHATVPQSSASSSAVCPRLQQQSLGVCERCVASDLCPSVQGVQYTCHLKIKKCVSPDWNSSSVAGECVEDKDDPSTWGAMCEWACRNEIAPFSCASQYCLNEDFPCKWTRGCEVEYSEANKLFAMTPSSPACLRSCVDHETPLKGMTDMATCREAIKSFSCHHDVWPYVRRFCPVSCGSPECPTRCGAQEIAKNGKQCWQIVEGGVDCVTAMKDGYDCSCKCASVYLVQASKRGLNKRGAFTAADKYPSFEGTPLDGHVDAVAGAGFSVSVVGEGMTVDDVQNSQGPRLMLIERAAPCGAARLYGGVEGLACDLPPGADPLAMFICTQPPVVSTMFYHGWSNIRLGKCADLDICHCNFKCDLQENWVRAGSVSVKPPRDKALGGGVSRPLPGCATYYDAPGASQPQRLKQEMARVEVVTATLRIRGGMPDSDVALGALQTALVSYLKHYSVLLEKTLPFAEHVLVELALAQRRLQGAGAASAASAGLLPPRRGCADDDAAFAAATATIGMGLENFKSCTMAIDAATLCNDETLRPAVEAGCWKTCGICGGDTGDTADPGDAVAGETDAGDTGAGTGGVGVGAGVDGLFVNVTIESLTNSSGAAMEAGLTSVATSPRFLYILFEELDNAGLTTVSGPLTIAVMTGPFRYEPQASPEPEKERQMFGMSDAATLTIAIVGGVALVCCCLAPACWCYSTYKPPPKVRQAEVVKAWQEPDPNSYRKQKHAGTDEAPEEEEEAPRPRRSWCWCLCRCLGVCWRHRPCCRRELLSAVAPSDAGPSLGPVGEVHVGDIVRLCGLSQEHYNGLFGTISEGPNEKGRYMVDILVSEGAGGEDREYKHMSFKPDNLQAVTEESPEQEMARYAAAGGGAAILEDGRTYRNGGGQSEAGYRGGRP